MSGASLAGSFDLAWSSNILHIIIPLYALVDWLLFPDRTKLPHKRLWLVLIYPVVWLVVILIRGATDGWVPYPFLDPATGSGSVTIDCIAISAFTVVFGLAVFALSRVRILAAGRRGRTSRQGRRGGAETSRRELGLPPRDCDATATRRIPRRHETGVGDHRQRPGTGIVRRPRTASRASRLARRRAEE